MCLFLPSGKHSVKMSWDCCEYFWYASNEQLFSDIAINVIVIIPDTFLLLLSSLFLSRCVAWQQIFMSLALALMNTVRDSSRFLGQSSDSSEIKKW